ncbi:TonB-dependent receptor domain-containing protein [Pseudodonghicola flavimaris]|uniref:TonB-dependent receptor n=1 Tax=Pseudodonghicola flavimaris TaxID=3050036 RepID=A0ABT7EV73_9RHOB|nr:TonB-dependent receptor [Pseudodonghicola flavimaris]MDK3016251.1 TonB-dependent receptor [Pseudodonghicola flavimaris]
MTVFFPRRLGATALLFGTISSTALAQAADPDALRDGVILDPIVVDFQNSDAGATATAYVFDPHVLALPPAQDGGEILASVPGVAARRMGGHGLDIIIRGMQKNQLNVIDAGSFTYGGCPNRMDPPSSIAAFYRADEVIVERGYASVTNGPGGSGGTVRLVRHAPEFEAGKRLSGSVTTGYRSNGDGTEIAGSLAYDLGHGFYIQVSGENKQAKDYQDGSGREVRSGFTQRSAGVTLGYAANGIDIAFDVEKDRAEDVKFAGAGMDSPLSETTTYRLRGGIDLDAGALTRVEGVLFSSDVNHTMDNYSLRVPTGMKMLSPTTSDTYGGKIEAQFDFGTTTARVGVDYQSNNRNAVGYMGMMLDLSSPSTLSWPDVTIAQTGLYGETETALNGATTLKLGLRYDHVRASAGDANGRADYSGTTPNAYYNAVYGIGYYGDKTEDNWGGLIRLEHQLTDRSKIFAGLSRSVRTADANERAMARGMGGMPVQIGNPDIRPEKHNQLDFGYETVQQTWSFNAAAFYDRVDDFILQDVRPGMMGSTTIYRNVSAELAGIELSGTWMLGQVQLAGDLTYTYGENRSDNRALGQIPPLQGMFSATYVADVWQLGARLNWAAAQTRVDPNLDAGATPGYGTVDLFGSYQLREAVTLLAGIDNLFDRTYATHLARANVFDTTVTQVNEPGRSLYVALRMEF